MPAHRPSGHSEEGGGKELCTEWATNVYGAGSERERCLLRSRSEPTPYNHGMGSACSAFCTAAATPTRTIPPHNHSIALSGKKLFNKQNLFIELY